MGANAGISLPPRSILDRADPSPVPAERVVRYLELVPPPDEETQCASARPLVARRLGEAALEQLERRLELIVRPDISKGGRRELPGDTQLEEPAFDALGAPRIECSPICREPRGKAGVVQIPVILEELDRGLNAWSR